MIQKIVEAEEFSSNEIQKNFTRQNSGKLERNILQLDNGVLTFRIEIEPIARLIIRFLELRSRWTISLSACRKGFDGMTGKSFFHRRETDIPLLPIPSSFLSSFSPFPETALRFPLPGRISKHTDSLPRSSFHVAFAFVKFLGRKTDGEATVLGSRRVEKLWPRCETSVALFSTRTSLPNSSRGIPFFFLSSKQDSEQDWNCFHRYYIW